MTNILLKWMVMDKFGGSLKVWWRRNFVIARNPEDGDGFTAHVL
jgi:hypothetical protein